MVFCAVNGCNNNNNRSSKDYNVECRYFAFPKSTPVCDKWVHKCYQQRKFNVKTARICSQHFLDSDFCIKEKLLKLPFKKWKLRPDSVPSVHLTKQKDSPTKSQQDNRPNKTHLMQNIHVDHTTEIQEPDSPATVKTEEIAVWESNSDECHTPQIQEPDSPVAVKTEETSVSESNTDECSQEKIASLEQELSQLKMVIQRQKEELCQVEKVFTKGQLRQLKYGHQVKWTTDDIAYALSVYAGGAQSYCLLRSRGFPLPGLSTLRRWAGKINVQTDNTKLYQAQSKDTSLCFNWEKTLDGKP